MQEMDQKDAMKLISVRLLTIAAGFFLLVSRAFSAPLMPPAGEAWRYQLLGESWHLDDCPPCAARPTKRVSCWRE